MITDEQIFSCEQRLLAAGWQAYVENVLAPSKKPDVDDISKLIHLRMAFTAGIAHILKTFRNKGVESPLLTMLFEQLGEQSKEMKKLCAAADAADDEVQLLAVLFTLISGMDFADVRNLRWGDIDREHGVIRVKDKPKRNK